MKKMLVLALALVLVFSGAAMAQEPVNPGTTDGYHGTFVSPYVFDDSGIWDEYYSAYDNHVNDEGEYTFTRVEGGESDKYVIIKDLDRTGYNFDRNLDQEASQKVEITLDVDAYIPCFLEMKLTGNQGTAAAVSYGSDTFAENNVSGFLVAFDNEIGGFLDEDWVSLGHGANAEINPVDGVYIGACDMFAVEVISNDNYRYSVESDALTSVDTGVSGAKLPMHMRTSVDGGANWRTGFVNFNAPKEVTVAERNPGVKLEALHNFRVPYNMNIPHGHYDGDITFRAITL